ncbi:MAG: arsenite-transporting ATPase, partial [bacterium]
MSTIIPTFLGNNIYSLLLFGGKGGVGKTSCATATAIHLAKTHNSDSFLLVSTDPAHSVADSLASSTPPSNLTVLELNAEKCLKEFKDKYSQQLREIALRGTFLDSGDIDQFLEFSLPGLDELMAFLEISKWVRSGSYKCVVVDTAPTGHTLRLLSIPELMGKWLGALESLLSKYRYMTKLYRGSHQTDATDNFLSELTSLVNYLEVLLSDSTRCCFVPVMLAEAVVISETIDLLKQLKDKKIPVQDIIVNRLYFGNQCSICEEGQIRQTKELLLHYG